MSREGGRAQANHRLPEAETQPSRPNISKCVPAESVFDLEDSKEWSPPIFSCVAEGWSGRVFETRSCWKTAGLFARFGMAK